MPVVPLPASLTADTPQPEIPDNLTWGQSLDLNVSLLSALGQCNRDKADIRQAERERGLQ
ncbi:Rz1 lytic protein [Klebsiella pneumoniae]